MTLNEYVKRNGRGTSYQLAKKLGIQPTNIYVWLKKRTPINAVRCAQIELLTGGVVTCEELNPEIDWKTLWKTFSRRESVSV